MIILISHIKAYHTFYSLLSVVRVTEPRQLRQAGYVAYKENT